ncbi:hypothetical protein GCM10011490_01600 [Pseudoclavibacter endophyticus]|uniref:Uncharacterized protein n=1 Tax=Pseudoclavibacter endophyticus TaxID=1778590 RepID=A0A6H9WHA6_9MICO|nr:hypothetical protein [Pseudoclavibacter endophyticus]KAB1650292.1 hypothetical protein F8O04_08905 [Pseudoclavibacter endophyticus]GGA55410.1 hypothetical protein GCM10011490_01600 [Pseudoclavibacter endophyticus]
MTTSSNEQARYAVLEQWANAAAGGGFPVPTKPHLVAIAQSGGVTPMLQRVREVGMWQGTIAWLVQQADAGVVNPLSRLPQHLVRPAGAPSGGAGAPAGTPAGEASPPQSREQLRFDRLRAWHGRAVESGVAGAEGLREMHLRLVANSHVTTAGEIRSIFPPVVGRFADQLEAALAGGAPRNAAAEAQVGGANSATVPGAAGRGAANGGANGAGSGVDGPAGGANGGGRPDNGPAPTSPATGARAAGQGAAPGGSGQFVAGAVAGIDAQPDRPADEVAMDPARSGSGASATAAAAPAPPPSPSQPDLTIGPEGFAPYEFGGSGDEPLPITLRRRPDGGIMLTWPPERPRRAGHDGAGDDREARPVDAGKAGEADRDGPPIVIDRLISSDEYPPYSPDAARLVVATRGTEAVDDLDFAHAARHYQVWRNVGTSIEDAKLSQPVKYASGELVSPVLDFDLREDEGRVIGQWRVLPGTTRVQVFRIPIQRAAGASGDPTYRILHDDDNLGGFVDTTAERGQRYLYQVFAEAEFDGVARLSAPTNHDLLVSAIHEPVRDLSFDLHDSADEPLFDLSWTVPPGGQVVIYRTERPPQPGIERNAVNVAALPGAGLPDDRRQSHPIVADGERASMRQVPWPRGWTRAYFTAVVLLGDSAYVGNTVRGVRVPKVSRPKVLERVNRQVLTFEWPDGADIVLAYSSMTGVSSEIAMQGQPIEVSRSDYREQGGLEFPRGRLDTKGCDLHLVSVAFDGGRRVLAAPEVITYPGLLRIWYRVLTSALPDGRPLIRVQLLAESDVDPAPPFVLVHNPDRMPLTVDDGRPIAVVPETAPNSSPQRRFVPSPLPSQGNGVSTWIVEPDLFTREVAAAGYLRLFAALPPEVLKRVALLDPDVRTLRLQPPPTAAGSGAGPAAATPAPGGRRG